MKGQMPLLPIGMQEYNEIRNRKAIYVDKTEFIPELFKTGKVIFCARPRRFGKSLLCSTLKSFYSGEKELFQGLAAEEAINSPDFVARPVITLDMSVPAGASSQEELKSGIMTVLNSTANLHNVALKGDEPSLAFFSLLEDVYYKYSKTGIVLIIDEYDAPIIKLFQTDEMIVDQKLLAETRAIIDKFYAKIKPAGVYLNFVFITGVTKFSGMGVFSTLNNLKDITLKPEFATIMGYTQDEIENNFAIFIDNAAKIFKCEKDELLERVKLYYDGFSFDGLSGLYNPQSILNFFDDNEFRNYWMESGSNSLIRKFLKIKDFDLNKIQGIPIDLDYVSIPGPIEIVSPDLYLYQAGYLTLRARGDKTYYLDYPNLEVRSSMNLLFMENLFDSNLHARGATVFLRGILKKGDVQELVAAIRRMYSNISYISYTNIKLKELGEVFYQTVLQSFLGGAGCQVTVEEQTNLGRIDLVARYQNITYVIEIKTAANAEDALKVLEKGTSQINKGNYAGPFINPIVILLVVDLEDRNIGAGAFWRDGEPMEIKIEKTPLSLPNSPRNAENSTTNAETEEARNAKTP
ncbi:MAG: ATP-binding protein [Deltaproteobacteria bacterium]|jgi:hypothetical protein|nr:ATP-binding protein [Deltaproteobacteria bacterium]